MPKLVNSSQLIVHGLIKLIKISRKTFNSPGFTLVELLIVIMIIGIASTVSIGVVGNHQADARDAQRKVDLQAVSTALQLYYQQNLVYPHNIADNLIQEYSSDDSPGPWIINLTQSFIKSLPTDPKQKTPGSNPGNCDSSLPFTYCYKVASNRQSFELWARLEKTSDPEIYNKPGAKCAINPPPTNPPPADNFNYCIKSN